MRISDWSSDVCSSDLRGTFILCNRRKPSRYIRELCEIAGDDVRFEAVDGKELDQCPRCLVGQMVERQGRNNTTFYGCNQFPECSHTQKTTRLSGEKICRQNHEVPTTLQGQDSKKSGEGKVV